MWWIDRWRQSDAYARMTAEEQGLYRNLCDEVFLRESSVIPDDPRILAKASGDHEAWARSGKSVLKSMKKVAGGWTNETALAVKNESSRRAKKQRDYRNGIGNDSGNEADNEPRPQEQDKEHGQETGKNGGLSRASGENSLTEEAAERLNDDFEAEEVRLRGLLVGIRDSGEDIQAVLDSLPRKADRAPFSAYTWHRSGRSGIRCSEGGLTVLRLTCDALEARQRAKGAPYVSDRMQKSMDSIDRVLGTGPYSVPARLAVTGQTR